MICSSPRNRLVDPSSQKRVAIEFTYTLFTNINYKSAPESVLHKYKLLKSAPESIGKKGFEPKLAARGFSSFRSSVRRFVLSEGRPKYFDILRFEMPRTNQYCMFLFIFSVFQTATYYKRRLSQHGRRSPPPSPREEEKLDTTEVESDHQLGGQNIHYLSVHLGYGQTFEAKGDWVKAICNALSGWEQKRQCQRLAVCP